MSIFTIMAELSLILATSYIKDIETLLSMRTTSKTLQSNVDLELRRRHRVIFKEEPTEEIGKVIYRLKEVYNMPICSDCSPHRERMCRSYRCHRKGCRGKYMDESGNLL